MERLIYADNAATTKLCKESLEAMMPWMLDEYGNASQPYSFARKPKKALQEARETIAKCINALPEEIYFTSGGTESDNWAIKGSVHVDQERNEVITSAIEHHAILNSCASIERLGIKMSYIVPQQDGQIRVCDLERLINPNTRLVSIMLANNEIGSIEPIKDLASTAHVNDILFHTDAVQAVGHIDIDVRELGVDMLSASAHKFNGPKGVGFLYVRKGIELDSFNNGGAQERGKRAGTENVAGIVGMAKALEVNCLTMKSDQKRVLGLEGLLLDKLGATGLDFVRNGSENHLPGNISLSFRGKDGEALLHRLDLLGICVSTGSACDSTNTQISHVLKAIKLNEEYARGTIRISLGKNNTEEDVNAIAAAILRVLRED